MEQSKIWVENEIVLIPVDIKETLPHNCVGKIFRNADEVYSISKDIEDIQKSHTYFKAIPYDMCVVSQDEINLNDVFLFDEKLYACESADEEMINDQFPVKECQHVIATTNSNFNCKRIFKKYLEHYVAKANQDTILIYQMTLLNETDHILIDYQNLLFDLIDEFNLNEHLNGTVLNPF